MRLNTRNFGEIEVEDQKVIMFEEGIPGFEMLKKFTFVDSEDDIFNYLQSIENTDICFIIVDPYKFVKDYAPVINESYFQKLGGGASEEFVLFSIVCLKNCIEESTINLAGPLLIHSEYKKGVQVVTEDKKYRVNHKLINLLNGEW